MESCHAYVRDLQRTRCVRFAGSSVDGAELLNAVVAATGLPASELRLLADGREVTHGALYTADLDGRLPSCTVLLRLCGGKVRVFQASPLLFGVCIAHV